MQILDLKMSMFCSMAKSDLNREVSEAQGWEGGELISNTLL